MTTPTINSNQAVDLSKSRAARKQHDDIVAWTKREFDRMKNARSAVERQWYIDLAFYFGRQYVQPVRPGQRGYTSGGTKLWVPPAPYWRSRPVINRVRPTIRTEIAQLTNNKPTATVVPASSEERDVYAAQAGEQIWEHLYTVKKLKALFRRAVWWNQVCGNSYIKTWWDFTKGEIDKDTGVLAGDICFAHETPFHVFVPDLLEETIEAQPYIIHARTRSAEYAQMQHKIGIDGKELKVIETSGREILDESFLNLMGNAVSADQKQRMVLELEVYVKPGCVPQFPNGAFYTIISDKIVQQMEGLPYSHKEYPFAKLDHIMAGKYYTTSSVEDLISLQKEYNRTHGQIIENKNKMSKLQLMAERGAVDASKMTSEPGQLIEYTPGFNPPTPAPAPALPAYVMNTLDRLLVDWNDISGQHEITHGQVPPGVTAATAISFLQERDETKLSPTFDSLEEAVEKTAKQSLVLIHDYWTVEKVIRVTGPDGSFDSLTFKGSDLADNLDVRIEAGSSLPTSKAAKQAFILDLMKMGFIDPQDGLEVLDMGGMNKINERLQADREQAQRENLRMAKATPQILAEYQQTNDKMLQANPYAFGQQPVLDDTNQPVIDPATGQPQVQPMEPPLVIPVNSWDNHKAHINYHNQYRKSQSFESLPKETQDLFEAHVNEHIQALGIESETMQPRVAAGLPPMSPEEMMQQQNQGPGRPSSSTTGPEPMPATDSGGPQ